MSPDYTGTEPLEPERVTAWKCQYCSQCFTRRWSARRHVKVCRKAPKCCVQCAYSEKMREDTYRCCNEECPESKQHSMPRPIRFCPYWEEDDDVLSIYDMGVLP